MNDKVVVFGEVLFDCFEDGNTVLGGAPFNVAWHLNGFELSPAFISRVGQDPSGDSIKDSMKRWNMTTQFLQTDASKPTGQVTVKIKDGQPSYVIEKDQAYDAIEADAAKATIDKVIGDNSDFILYHGSLIMRSDTARNTLETLIYDYEPSVFIDINLRPPWWDQSSVELSLERATWLKLNDEELCALSGQTPETREEYFSIAQAFCIQYDLEFVVLTMGSQGAAIITETEHWFHQPPANIDVVDTVGAGDAFSSVVILGLVQEWPLQKILQHALEFAAEICKVTGATINNRSIYESKRMAWQGAAVS